MKDEPGKNRTRLGASTLRAHILVVGAFVMIFVGLVSIFGILWALAGAEDQYQTVALHVVNTLVSLIVGAFLTHLGSVYGYDFGTSAGSAEKQEAADEQAAWMRKTISAHEDPRE
jgi:hypothetical protein